MKCLHGEFESAEECPKCIKAKQILEAVEAGKTAIPEVAELNKAEKSAIISIGPDKDSVVLKLYEESKAILVHAQSRVIKSNVDLKPATEDLSLIANYKNAIEDERKAMTSPIREKLNAINSAFKYFIAPLTEADTLTRNQILNFKQGQDQIRQEAERIEADKFQLAQDEMKLKGELTIDLTEIPKPDAVPTTIRTEVGNASTVLVWKYEVIDFALLDDLYKMPDTVALNTVVKKHHDAKQIPGIRIYSEEILRVNAR